MSVNMIKNISGKAWAWFAFAVVSFLFFVLGLKILITGIIKGAAAAPINLGVAQINPSLIGFIMVILGVVLLFFGITKTVTSMSEEVKRNYRDLGTA